MSSVPTLETVLDFVKDRETFARLLSAYTQARGDEIAPVLPDCMLEEFLPFLEDLTVVEVVGPGQIIYRICGTTVTQRIGHEVTGKNLLDFFPPDSAKITYIDAKHIVTDLCGNYSRYNNIYSSGRTVEVESISLPVRSEGDPNVYYMMSLHLLEEVLLDIRPDGETRVGIGMGQSFFFDLGNGVPEANPMNNVEDEIDDVQVA